MTDFEFARAFAEKKHVGQLYGVQPYIKHLHATYNVACQFDLTDKVKTACWLHDTLEDTKTTYAELVEHFGTDVAEMVYCVTDELGRDRAEKKAKTYPKIRANADAILVKLCDRIANIEASIENNPKKLDKYVKENKGFIEQLYSDDFAESAIWQHYFSLIA